MYKFLNFRICIFLYSTFSDQMRHFCLCSGVTTSSYLLLHLSRHLNVKQLHFIPQQPIKKRRCLLRPPASTRLTKWTNILNRSKTPVWQKKINDPQLPTRLSLSAAAPFICLNLIWWNAISMTLWYSSLRRLFKMSVWFISKRRYEREE